VQGLGSCGFFGFLSGVCFFFFFLGGGVRLVREGVELASYFAERSLFQNKQNKSKPTQQTTLNSHGALFTAVKTKRPSWGMLNLFWV